VHQPDRLKPIASCRVIVGTVKEPEISQEDGDAVLDVTPDPADKTLLNQENVKRDGLHVEIVPADQPGCHKGELLVNPNVPGLGRCTGRHIPLPKTGGMCAPSVPTFDTNHGGREIHPALEGDPFPRHGG
jgi:hypothetical protein